LREVQLDKNSSRFVAVTLTEAEWLALRSLTPDPCAWMKAQITRFLDESGVLPVRDEQQEASEWGALTSSSL
jgi:hypothetical protein